MRSQWKEEESKVISPRKWLLWIIVISICVRLVAMIILQSWEHNGNKRYGWEDVEIGSALASGLGFSWPDNSRYNLGKPSEPTAWQPPVYPLIIAMVFKVFGIYSTASEIVLMVIQTIISASSCLLIFLIGRKVFNVWVGLSAALMLALYPSAIHFSIQKIIPTNLIVFLLLFFIYQIIKLAETPIPKKSIFAGATFGIAVLTEPTMAAFFPFALVWLFLKERSALKSRAISIALVLLAVGVTISPWLIRNYIVFGRFVFIKSNLSRELFLGNYGNSADFTEERQLKSTLDEGQRGELYQKKVLAAIMSNPGQLIHQTSNRFVRYWTDTPSTRSNIQKAYGTMSKVAGISYLPILILGTAGLCLTILRRRDARLLGLAILSLPTPYYLTWFTCFRYRFPVEVILMVFAGYTIYNICLLMKIKMPDVALEWGHHYLRIF